MSTDNFRKHTTKNPLQRFLIEAFFNVFIQELRLLQPVSVLDVGCGEGFTLNRIKKSDIGKKLEGIDINNEAVSLGRKTHPELVLREGDVHQLPYAECSFDVVVCSEVLEHLEDPGNALREISRVTKQYILVSVPNEPFFQGANFLRGKNLKRWGNDIEHIQHWSSRGIKEFIGQYFNVLRVRTPFPWSIVIAEKQNRK